MKLSTRGNLQLRSQISFCQNKVVNDKLGPRPKCVWSCRRVRHCKRHLGDEEATAKQMYIKASKRASFARRRGNRQPGSSLVLSERGKGLAGLVGWASRVTVVLVGLGKARQGKARGQSWSPCVVVVVFVGGVLCWCAVSVSFSFIFCRNSQHAFQRTLPFCLEKNTLFFLKVWKNSLLSPPPYGPPPLPRPLPPKNLRTNCLRVLLAGWPHYYYYLFVRSTESE
jgi:hypothetical protein